jgi:hypothetical protein
MSGVLGGGPVPTGVGLPMAPQPQRKKLIELNQQSAVYFVNLDIGWPILSPVAVRVVQCAGFGYDLKFDVGFDFGVVQQLA